MSAKQELTRVKLAKGNMLEVNSVMNIKELAEYLGVHSSTIYRYAKNGNIPAFKIGSDWRFSKKHIDKWIDERTQSKVKDRAT